MYQRSSWLRDKKEYKNCGSEHLELVRYLGYVAKIAPKKDIEEEDAYNLPAWLVDLLDGDMTKAVELVAARHYRPDFEDQRLTIIEALLTNIPRSFRRRYLYWLELANRGILRADHHLGQVDGSQGL